MVRRPSTVETPAKMLPPLSERPSSADTKSEAGSIRPRRPCKRRGSHPTVSTKRPPAVLPPLPGSVRALATKVQITKGQFDLVKAVFEEHDTDKLGHISEEKFVAAVLRLDKRQAEREGDRVRSRFLNKDMGDTAGAMAELRALKGHQARCRHASSMYRTVVERTGKLELVDLLGLYYPHLPRSAVQKACDHHMEKPPPPPPPKTFDEKLDEAEGARDEITQIFNRMDGDGDGLVRVKSLEPLMIDLGIPQSDMEDWLRDLQTDAGGALQRMKSKLDVDDMQRLLGPAYFLPSPSSNSVGSNATEAQIKKQIDWDQNLALEVIYGKSSTKASTKEPTALTAN